MRVTFRFDTLLVLPTSKLGLASQSRERDRRWAPSRRRKSNLCQVRIGSSASCSSDSGRSCL